MKKILLFSLLCIALVGCEEKKVTNESLIGEWECIAFNLIAVWENGQFKDYDKGGSNGVNFYVKYYMKDDILMGHYIVFPEYDTVINPFNLDAYQKNNSKEEVINGIKRKLSSGFNYMQSDEFSFYTSEEIIVLKGTEEIKQIINKKMKEEIACKRIKNIDKY